MERRLYENHIKPIKESLIDPLLLGLSLLIGACQPLTLDEIPMEAAESPAQEASPGADNLGDPYYPQMGNGGYDAQHHTIDLVVDMDGQSITGQRRLMHWPRKT